MTHDGNGRGTDAGLLAPVWAGSRGAALVMDEAWLQAMLDTEVALTRAQVRLGTVPAAALGPITVAARAGRLDVAQLAKAARGAANPVVELVRQFTALVAEKDPDAAEYVHRGGTSQDILDTATVVVAARVAEVLAEDLLGLCKALAALAERHRLTPMAGRTLSQHAAPVTFGLKAAGWLSLALDALDRIRWLAGHRMLVQLGGAAGTLASYQEYAALATGGAAAVDQGADLLAGFAAELRLGAPDVPWHALRTPIADIAATAAYVGGAVGKFGLDVLTLSRTEIAEVTEPAAEGRGVSSAMPQKRNPVLATMMIAAARQLPGLAATVHQCLLSEDERAPGAWHAEWQPLRECLRTVAGLVETARELAEGLHVHPARMRHNLDLTGGAIVSERLNAALAPHLGRTGAKKLLTRVALHGTTDGTPFAEALLADPEWPAAVTGREVRALLVPEAYLGSAGALVNRVLTRYHASVRPSAAAESTHRSVT
ncbi:class-II fumarase/aspartase family protein [Streptomyces galilaeus]